MTVKKIHLKIMIRFCVTLILMMLFLKGEAQTTLLTEGWESASIGQAPPSGWAIDQISGVNHTWFKQNGMNPFCPP